MPVIEDELWRHPGNPGMIVVTSHASVDAHGCLQMCTGPELEAVRRIPGIERQCGSQIIDLGIEEIYGFLPVRPPQPDQHKVGFGLFQTKRSKDEQADLEIIQASMERLRQYLEAHEKLKIRMNFPGIGNGGLEPDQVVARLAPLPRRVTVCHRGEANGILEPRAADVSMQPASDLYLPDGVKGLFVQVETWLLAGRFNTAVEYLTTNGFSREDAMEQVLAVQRQINARQERHAFQQRIENW